MRPRIFGGRGVADEADRPGIGALEAIEDVSLRVQLYELFVAARRFVEDNPVEQKVINRPRIVLVSRRLSCVYMMLVKAGMPRLDEDDVCEVVYDRVLDGSMKWGGAKVFVIDDVLNYGSTMHQRTEALRSDPTVGEVDALVAAIDPLRASRDFIDDVWPDGLPDFVEPCDEKRIERFGQDLAVALYQNLTPYFTDFPLLKELPVESAAADKLRTTDDWMVADVTLPFKKLDQRSLSLVPTNATLDRIRQRLVPAAAELVALAKVRVFFGPTEDGIRSMRVVPMGIPAPTSPAELNAVLEELRGMRAGLDWELWTPQALHRLVQMYISSCVLTEFWNVLRALKPELPERPSSAVLDSIHLSCYFESERLPSIYTAFESVVDRYLGTNGVRDSGDSEDHHFVARRPRSGPFRHLGVRNTMSKASWQLQALQRINDDYNPPARPQVGSISSVSVLWAHQLLSLWAAIVAYQREAQGRLADDSLPKADRDAASRAYKRLRSGFTMAEIAEMLLPRMDPMDEWERVVVTLLLDMGNDLGAAVPSTHNEGQHGRASRSVYRQYRAGENAISAQSPVSVLARRPLEEAFQALDWLTLQALGIPRESEWSELSTDAKQAVKCFLQDANRAERQTTSGGRLKTLRVAWINSVTLGRVDVSVRGGSNTDPGGRDTVELEDFEDEDIDDVQPGRAFQWYSVATPGRSGNLQQFELLPPSFVD